MPWWRFWRPDTEDEQRAQELANLRVVQQKEAVEALERGDLPAIAKERIRKHLASEKTFFSSDLSINEFLLMKESGIEVISQVMGTCFYNVGYSGLTMGGWRYTGELELLTHAQTTSRALAMERMLMEAKLLGASGVVGVKLIKKRPDVGARMTEFTAYGTAVRIRDYPSDLAPFTSNLSGQEFWKLHKAGFRPKGVVMGCCSYYVYTDMMTLNQRRSFFGFAAQNQEMTLYTQSFYQARELAMTRMDTELNLCGAEGAVGVDVNFHIEEIEYEQNKTTRIDLLLNYTAMGTGIVELQPNNTPVKAPLMYIDLRKGKNSGTQIALEEYSPAE